jgi:dipeptidyl aminopeptidase/acylaminoacyl peptidase
MGWNLFRAGRGPAWPRSPLLLHLLLLCLPLGLLAAMPARAQDSMPFQKPPQEILQLVDVQLPPATMVDRDARYLALLTRPGYRSLAELAEPELKLAGLRINPRNHNRSRGGYNTGVAIREIASGREIPVTGLPDSLRIQYAAFSPKARYLSFVQVNPRGLSLWAIELATGRAMRVTPAVVSAVLDFPYQWSPDEASLYVYVRPDLKPYADEVVLPTGPVVQEATGKKAPSRTYQDLLRNKADERKFDHYATREVQRFTLDGESVAVLGAGIYRSLQISPDGRFLLVEAIHQPYSYALPLYLFPYRAYVADAGGKIVAELADKPLLDMIPITHDATEPGRRDFQWRADLPATVAWVEALDGGDPSVEVPCHDRLFQLAAPFAGEPRPLVATRDRFEDITWGEDGVAIVSDARWKDRRTRKYLVRSGQDNPEPKVLFEYSSEDLYHLPGDFVTTRNASDRRVLLTNDRGSKLYLQGEGYSPEGSRPFLDEFAVTTGKTRRLWQADGISTYEQIVRVLDPRQPTLLTRIESPTEFPNYYLRTAGEAAAPRQLTSYENPFKTFAGVSKEKIHYRREDGVELSADLYLPAGYDRARDGRLPMLLEAYPDEFKDKAAAGMVSSSPHRFVFLSWASPVFWAVRGYAVLENAQFPIVGEGDAQPNDTYIEQLVADARAAIHAVGAKGVVDTARVGVTGHSYGAFMTANLLAHSDLFAAGIARSGAYNRSLTPFGFQSEDRSYWEAPAVYHRMSPFDYADKIKSPLLLIHGEADDNPGTFTLQSERLFQAIKGLGGRSRLVLLPYEGHGYLARENILHMLWEMDTWLETYVKNRS